jgi:hypothetical protein
MLPKFSRTARRMKTEPETDPAITAVIRFGQYVDLETKAGCISFNALKWQCLLLDRRSNE